MGTIKALSWNVNGLRAALKKGFLEWLAHESPDIMCLQETKIGVDLLLPELSDVAGYHVYHCSGVRKGYSGVALYSKQEPRRISRALGVEAFDQEGRTLIVDYGDFVLCNVYFPNGRSSAERLEYKMGFYDVFLSFVDGLRAEGREIVLCGDVNTAHKEIDIARPKENAKTSGFLPQEREWVDKLVGRGYVDTFRMFNDQPGQYTWWDMMTRARDRNVGWRIDYFFVSEGLAGRVRGAWTMPDVMGSDHCPIGLELELPE